MATDLFGAYTGRAYPKCIWSVTKRCSNEDEGKIRSSVRPQKTGELVLFLFSTWSTHQNNHFSSSSSSTTFYNFGIFLHFFFFLSFCFWAGPLHWTFLWGKHPCYLGFPFISNTVKSSSSSSPWSKGAISRSDAGVVMMPYFFDLLRRRRNRTALTAK